MAGEKAKLGLVLKESKISLIATLTENGYVHYELFNNIGNEKRGVNANNFQNFLFRISKKLPRKCLIILDNYRIHHV